MYSGYTDTNPAVLHKEKERINTFWWTWSFNNRYKFAKAGFFAFDEEGNVQCFSCKLMLDWWTTEPMSQHAIRAPHCRFINGLVTNNLPLKVPRFDQMLNETELAESYDFMDSTIALPIIKPPSLFTIPQKVNSPHKHFPTIPTPHTKLPLPLYPIYNSIWTRYNTFTEWPMALAQTPRELSEAGFFYTQFNDKVTCFHCGGSLYQWDILACPWEQHALAYPSCTFLRIRRGKRYIASVLLKSFLNDTDSEPTTTRSPTPTYETNDTTLNCKICYINQLDTALIPCGHCVTCSSCVWNLPQCPICRTKYTGLLKIYLS